MQSSAMISVIVPVWREAGSIAETLRSLASWREAGHELVVVDGGSDDATVARARPWCDRVLVAPQGRAGQMNAGAEVARGEVLLFLHADTRLPASAPAALADFCSGDRVWGRFDIRLSGRRPLFRVIAWMMNQRSRITGIATGDQGIFVRRRVFAELGGYAPLPLMEDVELCRRLRRLSPPYCVADPAVTDSRRWEQQGAWRTIALMWRLRWRYWRGESPDSLARVYRSDVRRPKA